MEITKILSYVQIAIAVLLIVAVLLQNTGSDLGGAFGGSGTVYHTRRGPEKFLFWSTITLGVSLAGLALLNLFLV